jgi:exopolysaccharide biosynthesis polyprenyl glycosylphosphotransferase
VWILAAKLYGLYDKDEERAHHSTADDFVGVFHLVTVVTWLIIAVTYLSPIADPSFPKLLVFWLIAVTCVPIARAAGRGYCRQKIQYLQNTVILGAGDVGQALAAKLLHHPEYGLNLVGFVDGEPKQRHPGLEHLAILGDSSDLLEIVRLLDVERVIVAFSADHHVELLDLVRRLNDMDVQVDVVPRLFEVFGAGADMHTVEGVPVVSLPPFRLSRSSRLMKRGLDIFGAACGLLVLAPVFAVIAIAIKLDLKGPVFFRQIRAGSESEPFSIWKFRTMCANAEQQKDDLRDLNIHALPGGDSRMFKLADDPRVTRVGRVLRRYSLDELPQLVNVLFGEMSLVGPRPLILEEDMHVVEDWARRRLDLKPGITGSWQVLGRSEIPFGEMVRLDYVYVTNWTLFSDLNLIIRTIPLVVRGSRVA